MDCIFIDPPYNTGNEGWCYNDNVRSPLMKEWIKQSANPVEKDDLERHEKWLCIGATNKPLDEGFNARGDHSSRWMRR